MPMRSRCRLRAADATSGTAIDWCSCRILGGCVREAIIRMKTGHLIDTLIAFRFQQRLRHCDQVQIVIEVPTGFGQDQQGRFNRRMRIEPMAFHHESLKTGFRIRSTLDLIMHGAAFEFFYCKWTETTSDDDLGDPPFCSFNHLFGFDHRVNCKPEIVRVVSSIVSVERLLRSRPGLQRFNTGISP